MNRSSAGWLRNARLTVTLIVFPGSIRPSRTPFRSPGVTLRAARGFARAGAALAVSTVDPAMAMATSKLSVRWLSRMPPPKIARHHTEIALQLLGVTPPAQKTSLFYDGAHGPVRFVRRDSGLYRRSGSRPDWNQPSSTSVLGRTGVHLPGADGPEGWRPQTPLLISRSGVDSRSWSAPRAWNQPPADPQSARLLTKTRLSRAPRAAPVLRRK